MLLIRWEHPYFPVYYFQSSELRPEYLANKQPGDDADVYDLTINGKISPSAIKLIKKGDLKDYIKIESNKVDAWFEEDERIFGHPKDPYKRIIVLQSSKKVQIEIDGVEVASTSRPKLLYETGLPVRIYIPHTDVRLDLLEDDPERTSHCPYKVSTSLLLLLVVLIWARAMRVIMLSDCPMVTGSMDWHGGTRHQR